MTLAVGTKLGPYEIKAPLGAGRDGRGDSREGYEAGACSETKLTQVGG